MTDEAHYYPSRADMLRSMSSIAAQRGRVCAATSVHTNTIEGYFSIFKRGMKGIYQHCGKQHLHRYVAEFEFRYNNRIANGVEDGIARVSPSRGRGESALPISSPQLSEEKAAHRAGMRCAT